MYRKRVSIVVRTKNSSNIIEQTLKALYSQTFKNFELIIVDSGSTDDTLDKVSSYHPTLIGIKASEYHPGKVINHVMAQCTTQIVVFLNSDCVMLLPSSLQVLLNHLEADTTHAVFGRQIARPEAFDWVRRDYETAFPNCKEQPFWLHFSLPLAAIKKEVWEKVPFYTLSWASEDTKWAVDIKRKGYRVQYVKDALVMHSHNYNLKQLFNRKYVEGEAQAYICDERITLFQTAGKYLGSLYHDFKRLFSTASLTDVLYSISVRFVYHCSFYMGYKNGIKRKKNADTDITFGNYQ